MGLCFGSLAALLSCGDPVITLVDVTRQVGYDFNGIAHDAPIQDATVRIYDFSSGEKGELLAEASTNSNGRYDIEAEIDANVSLLLYEIQDGFYYDEVTDERVHLRDDADKTQTLTALVVVNQEGTLPVSITPWTHVAAGLAQHRADQGKNWDEAILSANEDITDMLGVDIVYTEPLDIVHGRSDQADDRTVYGFWTAALSLLAYDIGKKMSSIGLAQRMYDDMVHDGELDGNAQGSQNEVPHGFYHTQLPFAMLRIAAHPVNRTKVQAQQLTSTATAYQSHIEESTAFVATDADMSWIARAKPSLSWKEDEPVTIWSDTITLEVLAHSPIGAVTVTATLDESEYALKEKEDEETGIYYAIEMDTTEHDDGNYALTVVARDEMNAQSDALSLAIRISNAVATFGDFVPAYQEGENTWIRGRDVELSVTAVDPIGLKRVWFEDNFNKKFSTNRSGNNRWITYPAINTRLRNNTPLQGKWHAENILGTLSESKSIIYLVDNYLPSIAIAGVPHTWTKEDFSADITVEEPNLEKLEAFVNGEDVSDDLIVVDPDQGLYRYDLDVEALQSGTHTLAVIASDFAQNIRHSNNHSMKIDLVAPVMTPVLLGVLEEDEVVLRGNVDVAFNVVDEHSGVDHISLEVNDVPLSMTRRGELVKARIALQNIIDEENAADEVYTLTVLATDQVGNTAELAYPFTLDLSKQATLLQPDEGAFISGNQAFIFHISSPTADIRSMRLKAGDSSSSVTASTGQSSWETRFDTTELEDGLYDFELEITSQLATSRHSFSLTIDNTAPAIEVGGGGILYHDREGQQQGECSAAEYSVTEANPESIKVWFGDADEPRSASSGSYRLEDGESINIRWSIRDKAGNVLEGSQSVECQDLRTEIALASPSDGAHLRGTLVKLITTDINHASRATLSWGERKFSMFEDNGKFSYPLNPEQFDDGEYTVQILAKLRGYDYFALSPEYELVVDNTLPTVEIAGGGQVVYGVEGNKLSDDDVDGVNSCAPAQATVYDHNLKSVTGVGNAQVVGSSLTHTFAAWNVPSSWSSDAAASQQQSVSVTATDHAGNTFSQSATLTCTLIKQTAPTAIGFLNWPDYIVSSKTQTVTITVEDPSAIASVVDINSGLSATLLPSGNWGFTLSDGGVNEITRNYRFRATNIHGHSIETEVMSVTYDSLAPRLKDFTTGKGELTQDFTISVNVEDTNAVTATAWFYKLDDADDRSIDPGQSAVIYRPSFTSNLNPLLLPVEVSQLDDSYYWIQVHAQDAAGNAVATTRSYLVLVDSTVPRVRLVNPPDDWYFKQDDGPDVNDDGIPNGYPLSVRYYFDEVDVPHKIRVEIDDSDIEGDEWALWVTSGPNHVLTTGTDGYGDYHQYTQHFSIADGMERGPDRIRFLATDKAGNVGVWQEDHVYFDSEPPQKRFESSGSSDNGCGIVTTYYRTFVSDGIGIDYEESVNIDKNTGQVLSTGYVYDLAGNRIHANYYFSKRSGENDCVGN